MKNNNLHPPAFSHKLLRVTLAVAQIFSALSATLIGVAQPTLPASLAALQPLVGLPEQVQAAPLQQSVASFSVTKSVDKTVIPSGVSFNYTLRYACNSVDTTCNGVVITDVLPSPLEFVTFVGTSHVASQTWTPATRTLVVTFLNPLPAGATGDLVVTVVTPHGTTPNNTLVTNSVTATGANVGSVTSPSVQTTITATNKASLSKVIVGGQSTVAPDVDLSYQVTFCPEGGTTVSGALNWLNSTMTDQLPPNTAFVSASDGGIYSAGTNTVAWTLGDVNVEPGYASPYGCINRTLTLRFPTGSFTPGTVATNQVTVTGTMLGEASPTSLTASRSVTIAAATPGLRTDKTLSGAAYINPSGTSVSTFKVSTANTGTVPLSNVTITETVPDWFNVTAIQVGRGYPNPYLVRVKAEYQTNLNAAWQTLPGTPLVPNPDLPTIVAPTLATGEWVTLVRWTYLDDLPPGYVENSSQPTFVNGIQGRVISPTHSGGTVTAGDPLTNCVVSTGQYAGASVPNTALGCVTSQAADAVPLTSVDKFLDPTSQNGTNLLAGDTVTYRVRTNSVGSAAINGPVIMGDLLPQGLDFVSAVARATSNVPLDATQVITNYHNTGRTLLRFTSNSSLPPGQSFDMNYTVRVNASALAGARTNRICQISPVVGGYYSGQKSTDSDDLDDDGNTSEIVVCETSPAFNVPSVAQMESVKYVKGNLDTNWSKTPNFGFTTQGGSADYLLVITNTGTISMTTIRVIDILPWVGDIGVLDPTGRLTAWQPNLAGVVSASPGVTVSYSTSTNPCAGQPTGSTAFYACASAAVWSTTPPADISTVSSLKVDLGNIILQPGQSVSLTWPMRTPLGTPTGIIAWNTFAYVATRVDNNAALLPAEPNKVGIQTKAVPADRAALGDYVWIDTNQNGSQDEPAANGVNGVGVNLYQPGVDGTPGTGDDVFIARTVTGDDFNGNPGYYLFPALTAGDYFVKFDLTTLPSGYAVTIQGGGGGTPDASDSDASSVTGNTAVTQLSAGETDLSWDMGIYNPNAPTQAQFGNFVWVESDNDGIASTGTVTPLIGQVITAMSATGSVYTQTTNNQGYYTFTVPAGTYTVSYGTPPVGMLASLTPNASTASAASPGTDQRSRPNNAVVTLVANDTIPSIDFAFHPAPAVIGVCNRPYLDQFAETQASSTATGSPTATVISGSGILGGERDMAIASYTSNSPGALIAEAKVIPALSLFSVANDPSVKSTIEIVYDGIDGNATTLNPTGLNGINLSGTNDFLRAKLAYLDSSYHLTITVEIYTDAANASRQTLSFIGPVGAAQMVAFPVSGFTSFLGAGASLSNVGAVRILFASDAAADYTLEGVMFTPCDLPVVLGNHIWIDVGTPDGTYNAGLDQPAPNVPVTVTSSSNIVYTTTTDLSGYYSVSVPVSDTYTVTYGLPLGYVASATPAGTSTVPSTNDQGHSNGIGVPMTTTNNLNIDFALWQPLSLGNRLWLDTNNNGSVDTGEQNFGAGIDVSLYQDSNGDGVFSAGDTLVGNTQTNSSGYYTFTSLAPSVSSDAKTNYLVVITSSNFIIGPLAGYVNSTATTAASKLAADNDKDHGTAFGSGNTYYIASSAIQLTAGDQPTGEPNEGGDPIQTSNDANSNQTIDFGFYKLSVGNQVWFDLNDNGIKDGAEVFVGSGITVAILDTAGHVVSTTTTDSGGNYLFTGLVSGTYVISVTPPSGYRSSTGQVITDGLDLNDHGVPSGVYIVSQPFDLTPGGNTASNETVTNATGATENLNLDFGLYAPKVSLGNRVWFDADNNGSADVGESNVGAGVEPVLYQDSNGDGVFGAGDALISTTTTNSSGYYTFTNLVPSTSDPKTNYLVVITSSNFITGALVGYVNSSGQTAASKAAGDNDKDHGATFGTSGMFNAYVASSAINLTENDEPTGEGNEGNDPVQTIRDMDSNQTIDFGFYKLTLGNLVWEDYNNNGVVDFGEPAIKDVIVDLRDSVGTVVSSTTTDASGLYTFTGLISGTYRVVLSDTNFLLGGTLAGLTSSTGTPGELTGPYEPGIGEDNTLTGENSDHGSIVGTLGSVGGIVQSGLITLTPGFEPTHDAPKALSQQPTIDFGLFKPAQVGNYVWYDRNHDGIQDNYPGETGVPGVTVTLLLNGAPISTTYTDSTGHYSFTNLVAGSGYAVKFDLPSGLTSTLQTPGAPDTTVGNSDITPETNGGTTVSFDLSYGESEPDIDVGVWQPAGLGDLVWIDLNGDGIQNNSEVGVKDVTVTLFINDPINGWTQLSQTLTGNGGYYSFDYLISGTYTVSFSLPQGYTWTQVSANPALSTIDSNVISTTNTTGPIVLNSGERNPTIDGGIVPFAKLGDYVWEDYDHDGYQDAGEPAVQGVTVTLYLNGAVYSSTVTNAVGFYTFPQLISGIYTATFAIPQNFTFTTQTAHSANTGLLGSNQDSNVMDLATGGTAPIVLNWGDVNPTIDAGIYQPLSLGNRVWFDTNDDGIDNDGAGNALGSSTGVKGVTITLYLDANDDGVFTLGVDTWISDTQTDNTGYYTFTGLVSDTYLVVIPESNFMGVGALVNYQNSDPTVAADSDINQNDHGNVNGSLGAAGGYVVSGPVTLQYNTEPVNDGDTNSYTNYSIDFGFYKLEIGNVVWIDLDNNGNKINSEPAAPNVKVELLNASGAVISTTTTDSTGLYTFTNLLSGTYQVQVTPLAGYRSSTGQDTGDVIDDNDNGRPSTTNPALIVSEPFSLTAGAEPVVTTANGTSRNPTIDFGLYQPMVNLGNQVWFDTNDNGLIDGAEVGVPGVTVTLYTDTNGDGIYTIGIDTYVSTTTTIGGGFYTFTRLPEGDYLVVLPASNFVAGGLLYGYKSSDVDNTAPNDNINSDDNGILTISGDVASRAISLTVGSEPSQTIAAGDSNWTVDFGFYKLTLGNVVWEDYNNDGIHNAGEPGIAGVSVTLYDVTGTTSISQTTTDANGAYTFTNLYSGTYVVGVMPPAVANGAPYQSSLGTGGETDPEGNVDDTSALVSDNGVNVMGTTEIRSNPITMTAGAEPTVVNATGSTTNPTLDFGLFRPASLGDYVWFDQNRDGLQNDPTSNGLNGVTVTLYYNGVPSLTQVTANNGSSNPGYYNFTGLVSGTYTVAFTLPANYTWTQQTGTLTDTLNSDVNMLGVTAPAVVMPGTSNPYVDAGLKLWPVSLGNRVWIDSNNNGQVDLGEQNVPSVTVQLYLDSDGSGAYSVGDLLVSSTVTSASGYYTFTDLVPSDSADAKTHYLVVIPASNFQSGGALAGLLNSTPTTAPSKSVADNDKDHGMTVGGVVASGPIQLTQNDEPIGEPNEGNDPTIDKNSNQTIDFGFYKPNAAIGNYVWLDEDADGQQDAGEPGIPNAVVQMTDGVGKTYLTTTDANGRYLFPNLPAGTYTVKVLPSNFGAGAALEGLAQTPLNPIGGADFGNQDQNGYAITVADGETNLSGDFGYIRNPSDVNGNTGLAALGDRVWIDSDGDGKQDPDEVPVSGVVLTLFGPGPDGLFHTADDVPLGTQTTDANGNYLFTDLPAGAYQVEVTDDSTASHKILGADYAQTGDPDHFGTSGTANDNITSTPVILGPGDVFLNADFGYQPKGSAPLGRIGDTVWFDANASGTSTPDAGEYGIPNVSVALIKDINGNGIWDVGEPIIATDVTDANGQYLFSDLPLSDGGVDGDADYIVWVNDVNHALADLRQTYDEDAPLDNMSHTALSSGMTQDLNQDFSYTPVNQWPGLGAIGDTVWFDANNSGSATPDVGEHGIQGVLVVLNDAHGNMVTTTTDSNGRYYFGGLPLKETYTVTVAAENFLAGGVLEGMRETYDQDAPMTDNQSVTTLTVGAPIDLNQDFSYVGGGGASESTPGRIGNLVWLDTNTDGHFDGVNGPDGLAGTDDNEPIMAGVTVDLYLDLNGNGKVDAGEPMLASTVTVGTLGQGTNGADGNYIFEGLPTSEAGIDYVVVVSDRAGVLNGYWKSDGPNDGANNNSQANEYDITLTTTAHEDLTADFGYYLEPAALGNYVWYDKNKDGKQDATEPPIADVVVTLVITYPNGTVTTLKTTADENGHYEFQNLLLDEDYGDGVGDPQLMISVANPTGYLPTTLGVGDPKTDSNLHSGTPAIPEKGHTDVSAELSPLDEQVIASYDFGFWKPAELGNYVWVDSNKDGIQNEPAANGVNGITATLYVSDAINGWSVLSTTLTGNDVNGNPGYYTFSYLISGMYYVKFDVPLGYIVTVPTPGTANGNDADLSGQTGPVDLPSETSNPDIDMGLWVPPLRLGNQVWKDVNNNGIVDAGEVGVAGATVDLYKDTNRDGKYTPGVDVKVATSTTVAGGYYTFTNLIPGDYLLVLPASNFAGGGVLVGYRSSDPTSATPNNNVDNDDNGAPNARGDVASNVITLFPFTEPTSDGDSDTNTNWTVDFGVWLPAGLGDRVWKDNNGNGVQDPGEPGVPDVTVTLQTVTGTLTTKTDVNGNYVFTGLLPGTYTVTFGLPTGFSFTTPDVGSNDANDSDANRATGVAQPVTLNPGDNNLTIDAGIIQPATLGNYVWLDVNQDGLQGPDEIAVPGVTVTLYVNGQVVSTTVTDAKGQYQFVDLIPGVSYTLNFQLPTGFAFTLPNIVGPDDDNKDSDADSNGNTAPIVLGPGENNTSVDAGIRSALVLEKAAVGSGLNNTIGADGLITYTVKVTNIGTAPAANMVISDPLTIDTEYVIGSGVPTPSSVQPVVWTIASIGPGASQTIRFTVKVLATDDSTKPITNTIYLKNRSNIVAPDAFVATANAPITRGPTAVTLARFEVAKVDGQVNVMWQTSLEQDTYGFNLYRAESDDRASAVKVSRELIVATGRNGGASYVFVDVDANVGKRYAYWLQETELSGRINEYGPALFGTAKAAVLTNVLADVLVLPGGVPVSGVSPKQVAEARAELPQAVVNGTAVRELTVQTVGIQPVVIAQAGVAADIAVVKPAAAAAQTDVTQPAAALSIPVAKPAVETSAVVEASTAAQAVEAVASRPAVRTLSGVNTPQMRGLTKNLSASGLPSVPSAGVEQSSNALPVWVWLMAGLLALTLGVVTGTVVMRRKRNR